MQTENCHLRSGGDSLSDEAFVAAVAVLVSEMVLVPFEGVIDVFGGLS